MIPTSTDDYRKILDFIGNKNSVGFRIDILNTYGITEYLSDNYQPNEARYASLKTDQINRFGWAKNGFLNIVGGCCGSAPEHIRAMGRALQRE